MLLTDFCYCNYKSCHTAPAALQPDSAAFNWFWQLVVCQLAFQTWTGKLYFNARLGCLFLYHLLFRNWGSSAWAPSLCWFFTDAATVLCAVITRLAILHSHCYSAVTVMCKLLERHTGQQSTCARMIWALVCLLLPPNGELLTHLLVSRARAPQAFGVAVLYLQSLFCCIGGILFLFNVSTYCSCPYQTQLLHVVWMQLGHATSS